MTEPTNPRKRFAVQSVHKGYEPMFLYRTQRAPNYRSRNPYASTSAKWCQRAEDALTWANRETAERHAEAMQAHADSADHSHYRSHVGDTTVTVIELEG